MAIIYNSPFLGLTIQQDARPHALEHSTANLQDTRVQT